MALLYKQATSTSNRLSSSGKLSMKTEFEISEKCHCMKYIIYNKNNKNHIIMHSRFIEIRASNTNFVSSDILPFEQYDKSNNNNNNSQKNAWMLLKSIEYECSINLCKSCNVQSLYIWYLVCELLMIPTWHSAWHGIWLLVVIYIPRNAMNKYTMENVQMCVPPRMRTIPCDHQMNEIQNEKSKRENERKKNKFSFSQ